MEFRTWLEDFEQWNGRWIHYSHGVPRSPDRDAPKVPLLKINYKMMWNDPLGIYFFPEKFQDQTGGNWHNYKFKYIVEFPTNMKIFDFAKFNNEEFSNILSKHHIKQTRAYDSLRDITPADRFWMQIEDHFKDPHTGSVFKAKMNKFFRDMGYDALFDDTNAIFRGETQLVLLNPTVKYKVIDIQKRSTSGWNEMTQVIERIENLCKPYGEVKSSRENKKFSGWDQANILKARIAVNQDNWKHGPYVSWEVRTARFEKQVPTEIFVELYGATPKLELFSSGKGTTVSLRTMNFDNIDKLVSSVMHQIWATVAQTNRDLVSSR